VSAPVIKDLHALGARLHLHWLLAPLVGVLAGLLSYSVIGTPVWLAWLTTDHGTDGVDQLFRLIGSAWLAVQTVPVQSGGAIYAVLPWGLVIVPMFFLYRGGVILSRRLKTSGLIEVGILGFVAAIFYGLFAIAVSNGSSTAVTFTTPWRAGLTAFIIALAVLKVALLRSTKSGRLLLSLVSGSTWALLRAAGAGLLALLGAGAVLALISLIWHFSQVRGIFEFLTPNFFGGLLIALACIGYFPVLIIWATSYMLGAGFAIGPGIGLSPFVPAPPSTQLPAFPLLAAIPEQVGPIAWGLPVIAVVIGVGVGVMVARSSKHPALVRLGLAVAATVLTAIGMGLLSWLTSGSLGDVRLAKIGPDPVLVGLLAFALTAIGAVPTALALRIDTGEGPSDVVDPSNVAVNVAVREIEFEEIDEVAPAVVAKESVEVEVDEPAPLASKNLETEVIAMPEIQVGIEGKDEDRGI
jgi:Family of unknown function (DUF6350)